MKKDAILNMCASLIHFSDQPEVMASSGTNHFSCSVTLFLLLPFIHAFYPHTAAVLGSTHWEVGRITYTLAGQLSPA